MKSKRWIVAKGLLFLFLAVLAGALNIVSDVEPGYRAILLGISVWASCRFYYFLFHVLHAYVDPTLPSAGVVDLLKHVIRKSRAP